MFLRLLYESFRRQRRRKLLAGVAILLGTTAVTAMLALATTIGDRIHQELAVYGANIIVTPQADSLDVKVGGVNLKPANGGAYLHEKDLEKLHGIFWANNITGVSPELPLTLHKVDPQLNVRHSERSEESPHSARSGDTTSHKPQATAIEIPALGLWFNHRFASPDDIAQGKGFVTGAPALHTWWKLSGSWPSAPDEIALGASLAKSINLRTGDSLSLPEPAWQMEAAHRPIPLEVNLKITGIVSTGDATETKALLPLETAQTFAGTPDAVSRVEISARTKPEDAFARSDPDKLTGKKHDLWYCSPYANSIAYQIREAIPGANAQQVRRVEQSEGTVLSRISGLMWLISAAALLAAGFAVSAAMATAILERRAEIGLMRSLGASRGTIALLFYSETGLLAIFAGACGYLIGSSLAAWLGAKIFATGSTTTFASIHLATVLNPVLLPIVVGLALIVAIAGSTPAIRQALRMDPSAILRADA
jgi:putative ABC transport system permease protein